MSTELISWIYFDQKWSVWFYDNRQLSIIQWLFFFIQLFSQTITKQDIEIKLSIMHDYTTNWMDARLDNVRELTLNICSFENKYVDTLGIDS